MNVRTSLILNLLGLHRAHSIKSSHVVTFTFNGGGFYTVIAPRKVWEMGPLHSNDHTVISDILEALYA